MKIYPNLVPGFLLCAVLFMLPTVLQAQFTFTTNNGTITITEYTGPGGVVVIPSSTNGLPVTSIGANAFSSKNVPSVTGVTIPNSVTNIGYQAFSDCWGLTNVTIPGSIINFGQFVFENCSSLTNVTINTGVTSIGTNMFYDCFALASVTIPNGVTSIPPGAFYYCGMPSITIPGSVTSIAYGAFESARNLTGMYFLGNAPSLGLSDSGSDALEAGHNLIVYHQSFTTGWTNTFGGYPTALWTPPQPALAITTYSNQPVLYFPSSIIGTNYVLLMTTNLASGNWVAVTNSIPFTGVQISNAPSPAYFRFQ